jgi:hypothetical protein
MSRPPDFTNRCCKLVSDQVPIGAGSEKLIRFPADAQNDRDLP